MISPLAHRKARRMSRPTGIGMFAGLAQIQDPSRVIGRGLLGSLMDQPGIRLAEPTGRRVYYGTTAHQVQRFTVPAQPNRSDSVRAGRAMNARRSLGRGRGLAPQGVEYAA